MYYNQVLILPFHPVYLLQTGSAAARDAELILDRVPEHVVVMLVEDRKHMKIVPEPRAGIWGRRGCHAIEDSRRGEPATKLSVGGSFAARWARMVLKRCSSERGEREKRFYGDGKDERRRTAF